MLSQAASHLSLKISVGWSVTAPPLPPSRTPPRAARAARDRRSLRLPGVRGHGQELPGHMEPRPREGGEIQSGVLPSTWGQAGRGTVMNYEHYKVLSHINNNS